MEVDFKGGLAEVACMEGKGLDPTGIPKAVLDTGFTPGEVTLTAVGILGRSGKLLVLEMTGPVKTMVLAGGERIDELSKNTDLQGRHIRVTGKLHTEKPPGLTVETWVEADSR